MLPVPVAQQDVAAMPANGVVPPPPEQIGIAIRRSNVAFPIYIDAADTTAAQVWLDPAKAQEWVLAQLKGQGIVMRAA